MKCPKCKKEFTPAGQSKGGKAKVKKGFASNAVQTKAQQTRAIKRKEKAK